jgi:hypothetical protein
VSLRCLPALLPCLPTGTTKIRPCLSSTYGIRCFLQKYHLIFFGIDTNMVLTMVFKTHENREIFATTKKNGLNG